MVFNYWGGRLVLRKPVKLAKTLLLFLSFQEEFTRFPPDVYRSP